MSRGKNDAVCTKCQKPGAGCGGLVGCSTCERAYHRQCVTPPLTQVGRGNEAELCQSLAAAQQLVSVKRWHQASEHICFKALGFQCQL